VRWREGNKLRSRTFPRKRDASAFDVEVKTRLARGPHLARELDRAGVTLDAFIADGFQSRARHLARGTRIQYAWAAERHFGALLNEPLAAIDVRRVIEHQDWLLDTGRTPHTAREVLKRLSGVMQAAVRQGLVPFNPVRSVDRVPIPASDDVQALIPVQLEQLVAGFTGRDRVIVLLCGHLGLRPLEARKALWSDLEGSTLTIHYLRTKPGAKRSRAIAVPALTLRDLRAWQLQSGGRGDEPIIGDLAASGLSSWQTRTFNPAIRAISANDAATLYTLRHTHASVLHYCGWTVPDAARRLGHGPVVHMGTYAHPIERIGSQRWRDLDDLIAEARADVGIPMFPQSSLNV
jgi:integrase